MHPSWFYKHQHDSPVRSKLFVACQQWWFLLHTHPVSWNCAYLRMELSDGGSLPNLVRNCCWTIVTDQNSWNVSTQKAFSLPLAAILVNCAPSGEMHNYCTPHIIKENFENFLIHRCNYILLSQVYCVWQVVKTPTIISSNPVYSPKYNRIMKTASRHAGQTARVLLVISLTRLSMDVSSGMAGSAEASL